jgi:RimJ/RimL family protein N-acetyltransferase
MRSARRIQVRTERLLLWHPRRSDTAAVLAPLDDVTLRAQGWTDDTLRVVTSMLLSSREYRNGHLVLSDLSTREIFGTLSIGITAEGNLGLGFLVGPRGRGRGLALEALRGALPYFHGRGASSFVIETAAANVAMRRIAEAARFTHEADYVHMLPNGKEVPAVRYRLVVPGSV